ncbi:MAG: MFS transporter [Actinobacteria bacterium]|nr:MFS transporter [Actinomycetota bacterium]
MRRRPWLFGAFALAYFLSNFFRSANAVISGDLSREFSLGATELGLMTAVFFVVFALVQLPLGGALDRWGPRIATPVLMMCAVIGSLVFAGAHSFASLVVGRALIGAGMGGVLMGAYTAFSRWYSPRRFATVSGVLVGLGALGSFVTGAPLAWAVTACGWRTVFLAASGVVLMSALAVAVIVRNVPPGAQNADEHAARVGGDSSSIKALFRDRRFWPIALLNLSFAGTLLTFQGLWFGPYLFDALGFSRTGAGTIITLAAIGGLVGYFSCGWMFDHWGRRQAVVLGMGAFLIAQLLMVLAALTGWAWLAYPTFVLFGYGGGHNILTMAHVRTVFPVQMIGRAVTGVNMFGLGGAALLQYGVGALIAMFPRGVDGSYPPQAYGLAVGATAALGVLALIWYLQNGS